MKNIVFISGPCAIENYEQISKTIPFLISNEIEYIRFNLYKYRTSPYDFQGVGDIGMTWLKSLKITANWVQITTIHP